MFHFKILYLSGKSNADADVFSRLPHRSEEYSSVPERVLKAVCQRHDATTMNNAHVECISMSKQVVEDMDIFKKRIFKIGDNNKWRILSLTYS